MQQEKYKLAIVAGVFREGVECKKSHMIQLKTKKSCKNYIIHYLLRRSETSLLGEIFQNQATHPSSLPLSFLHGC